jgi:ComF family protein
MLKPFFAAALDIIFPPLCHVCRNFISTAGEIHICPECRELMPPIVAPLCIVCGIPFAGAGTDHVCGRCSSSHPFKYRNKTHLRRPLALLTMESLSEFIQSRRPDLIMPVPLHRKKLSSRGFNQALLLGEILSQRLKIPLDRRNLRRIRWTEPQVNLAAADRRLNVKGAFAIHESAMVKGRRVLLVDDVLTTGSTVEECGRVLKASGAADVTVITVARALA